MDTFRRGLHTIRLQPLQEEAVSSRQRLRRKPCDGTLEIFVVARSLLLLLASFAVLSCRSLTEPGFPSGAVLVNPPQPYAFWWELAESCSGATGDFANVHWYFVPGHSRLNISGKQYDGYWFPRSKSIVLTADALLDGPVVRHEMLHALIGAGHPREQFVERCGGIVACSESCALEAGGPFAPDSMATTISTSSLTIGVSVQPNVPSQAREGGWIAITVTARNPLSAPAWAQLSPVAPGSQYAPTFGYIVRCLSSCTGGSGDGYDWVEGVRFGFDAVAYDGRPLTFTLAPARTQFAARSTSIQLRPS